MESDAGSKFVDKNFTNLSKNKNIRTCSRKTSLGAGLAERFNRTTSDSLKKPVFETVENHRVDIYPQKRKTILTENILLMNLHEFKLY